MHFPKAALTVCLLAIPAAAETLFGVTDQNTLVTFSSLNPSILTSQVALSGLQMGEKLVGIDFRPATGQLFGVGSSSRLYSINRNSGAATAVGAGPFAVGLNGTHFGMNFNPVADRIRIVSDTDQNFRVNPNTGASIGMGDTALTYGDPLLGSPTIFGTSYTNSTFGTQTTTTQFFIDPVLDILGRINFNAFNGGVIQKVGNLNVNVPSNGPLGFDISGATGTAYLASGNTLWTVNQMTGKATLAGSIGAGSGFNITAISAEPVPEPSTLAAAGLAALALAAARLRKRSA